MIILPLFLNKNNIFSTLVVVITIVILTSLSNCDLFTSIAELERLVDTQKEIPLIIEEYIQLEEKRLNNLKKVVDKYRVNNNQLKLNLDSVSNPINAFKMIKRLTNEWNDLENRMRYDSVSEFLDTLSQNSQSKFPAEEDLSGAVVGLLRLQDTYRLSTKDLANGIIRGRNISASLSAFECFEIGRNAYNNEDYYHTLMWMEEAMNRLKDLKEDQQLSLEIECLEYLAFSMYKQNNVKHALRLTEKLYKIAPNHSRAKGNIKWYEDEMLADGIEPIDFRRFIPNTIQNRRPETNLENKERVIYEALCRNEVPVSVTENSKLYCYYKMDQPYLRLAPFKVEILRFNPLAVLFRNTISDEEIKQIQELSKPKLARATVQNSETGKLETASYRISKSAWLKEQEGEVVQVVNKRLHLMTNLEMETAEELQIANYGIGGHYDPHFDFARKEETKAFSDLGTGNRIATVLFYMTQPEEGGGTVFTELKTAVQPSKNDALFWYNLLRSGEGDLRTRHAACPVLLGIKWVSNKWIHELGQDVYRPCGLYPSIQERYVGDLGGPEPRYHFNISPYPKK